jgi:hypothetical protein
VSCVKDLSLQPILRQNDTFRQVFEETADLAQILSDSLVVSFGGKRVFSSASPNSLKIWAEGELGQYIFYRWIESFC